MTTNQPKPPQLPYDELRAGAGDNKQAQQSVDALRSALNEHEAERSHVEQHVGVLRAVPALTALVENWYEQPSTQNWLKTLSDIGL
jgi:hypothetical protein